MYLVSPASEFGGNVLRELLRIASCHVDINSRHPHEFSEDRDKVLEQLYFVKEEKIPAR